MKKHLTTLALCVFTLLCVTLSAFGSASQNNTVLTKSYLEGTYWRELQGIVSERAAASVGNLAAPALKRLEELGRSYVTALVPEDNGGASWLTASGYVKQGGETGDSITLSSSKVQFVSTACNNGDWKIESALFDTEAEAEAWAAEKLPAST